MGRATRQGLRVDAAFSIPGAFDSGDFVGLASCPDAVLGRPGRAGAALDDKYLHAVVWSILPYLWFVVTRCFVTALSRAGAIMTITLGAVGLNLALNYVLAFGKLGLPSVGVAGAGWATTILTWATLAALCWHTARSTPFRAYRVFSGLMKLDWSGCRKIIRLDLPAAGVTLSEGGF